MVDADETLVEVWRKMEETAFSQFPVKWRGRVVGSITEKKINQLIKGFKPTYTVLFHDINLD